MKKGTTILAVGLLSASLLAACSSSTPASESTPSSAATYKDGIYKAEAPNFDERGWKGTIEIKVEGGKITAVTYDEVNQKDGHKKSEDDGYKTAFKDKKGIDLVNAYDTLEQGLIDKQDPDKVDTYTGATGASTSFKTLAKQALDAAKSK